MVKTNNKKRGYGYERSIEELLQQQKFTQVTHKMELEWKYNLANNNKGTLKTICVHKQIRKAK